MDPGEVATFGYDPVGTYGGPFGRAGVYPAIGAMYDQNWNLYLLEVEQGQTGVGPLWYSVNSLASVCAICQ